MKILLVVATNIEIKKIVCCLDKKVNKDTFLSSYLYKNIAIDVLITGVGMVNTAYKLGVVLACNSYDLVVNAGIAGSFDKSIAIGDVLNITEDQFSELGIELRDGFKILDEAEGLNEGNTLFDKGIISNINSNKWETISKLSVARGITVNTVHGRDENIGEIKKMFSPTTESMEGAAFLFCCLSEKVPCVQIRSISNFVEEYNKSNWDIPLALDNLRKVVIDLFDEIVVGAILRDCRSIINQRDCRSIINQHDCPSKTNKHDCPSKSSIVHKPLSLGFSSCPNDTFIFDAIYNKKIDTEGLDFSFHIADVEELNKMALKNVLDISKLSMYAYTRVSEQYKLLDSGGAYCDSQGPLVIAKQDFNYSFDKDYSVAIPGINTTANFLFKQAFPLATNIKEMLFSEIEEAVLQGDVDLGVVIHESRFTYEEKGLKRIIDLGEFWTNLTNTPVPLGGIFVRESLSEEIREKINRVIKRSIIFAFENKKESYPFILEHAKELEKEVIDKHIGLYVNEYTVSAGERGREAVEKMVGIGTKAES